MLKNKFTALQNNDLYISGESYAGIYVPQLVMRVDKYINDTKPLGQWVPNLKGFMVGNGVTNWKYDCTPAYFHMSYYHGLISDELFNTVNANCDLSYFDSPNPPALSDQCKALMEKFGDLTTLVNIYDVFGKCYRGPNLHRSIHGLAAEKSDSPKDTLTTPVEGMTASKYTPFLGSPKKALKVVPPCVYAKPVLEYFNNDTIKTALHILPQAAKWDLCQDDFNYTSAQNAS